MKNKFIFCDPEKCLGCLICEFACSAIKEKSINPLLSRIRVVNLEPAGSIAVTCTLCDDTPCVKACPRKALRRDNETGVVLVDEDKCNGCRWCFEACPFGAIAFNPYKRKVMICDLCDGNPECVKYCPFNGALTFSSIEEIAHNRRTEILKKILKEIAGKEA
ncbi:MAG: 4Fe-4S dicluster domain-containing protein [Candidatus Bathyarchaeia archaeon]